MEKIGVFVLSLVLCTAAIAGESRLSFETGPIALLTREEDMSRRAGGSAVELGEYILQLKSAGAAYVSSAKDAPKVTGAFVVVIKPERRSRILVHLIGKERSQEFIDGLSSALQAVAPPVVVEGPVAMSVSFRTSRKDAFPIPFVGVAALYGDIGDQSGEMDTDALIERAWPDDGG